ncbi:MAG: hypothetical protein AAGJ87_11990 [Pseudomonadota bacterium]
MGALTGFVAGVAAVIGVSSLIRYAEKRFGGRDRDPVATPSADSDAIDFEQDPTSGAYRLQDEPSKGGR